MEDRLAISEITLAFAKELMYLAPFGEENRAPLFAVEGTLSAVRTMGKDGAHLSARLSDGQTQVRIVSFGNGDRYADWSAMTDVRAFVSIELSSYLGKSEVSVRAEALKVPADEAVSGAILACLRSIKYGLPLPDEKTLSLLPKVSEAEIRAIFRTLQPRLARGAAIETLSGKERTALLPLYEIGVVRFANGTFFAETVQEKKQIQNALLYRVLCLE